MASYYKLGHSRGCSTEHDISIAHGCASVFANSTVRMLSVCIQTQATLPTVVHPSDVYCDLMIKGLLPWQPCLTFFHV